MTRAALYARKSSLTGDREEARSTTRQLEDGRAFALARQWAVAGEYIEPEGTSGGSFQRPAFGRMLADAQAGAFDVVVAWDFSRFSRADPLDALFMLRQLGDASVTVWDTSTGAAVDVETEMGALVTHVTAISSASVRKATSRAVRATKQKQAREGYASGPIPMGYRTEGERKAKRIVVDPKPAALVRKIFGWYAQGWTIARITKYLNARGTPNPNPKQKGEAQPWSWTTIRQILERDMYRGKVITNRWTIVEGRALGKARKTNDGRTRWRAHVQRPRSEWIVREAPELKLIDDRTLAIVDERLADREAGKHGRSFTGKRVPLLSGGALKCDVCGRRFETDHGTHYICSSRRRRLGCTNSTRLPIEAMDRAVINALEDTFLPEHTTDRLLALLDTAPEVERRALDAEAERLRTEISNLVATAAAGAPPEVTGPAIAERKAALTRVEARLKERPANFDREVLRRALVRQAGDWRAALHGNPLVARELIARALDLPIVIQDEGEAPGHVWKARADPKALASGMVLPHSLTSAWTRLDLGGLLPTARSKRWRSQWATDLLPGDDVSRRP